MGQIRLQTKAETLKGLYGELEKRQADFKNYAESVLRETLTKNGGKSIDFGGVEGIKAHDYDGRPLGEVSWLRNNPIFGIEVSKEDEDCEGFIIKHLHLSTIIKVVEALCRIEEPIGEK